MSKEQMIEDLEELFLELYAEYPQSALALIIGLMVGLLEHNIKQQDGDPERQIVIESDGRRKITIHAKGEK